MRQGEMLYTETSIRRVVYQPLGTSTAFAEGLRRVYMLDVNRPSPISRLIAATYGDGGEHPCRRAVNRFAQNPGLHTESHATCHLLPLGREDRVHRHAGRVALREGSLPICEPPSCLEGVCMSTKHNVSPFLLCRFAGGHFCFNSS